MGLPLELVLALGLENEGKKLSDLLKAEQKRYWTQFARITKILKQHRARYRNKTDVLEEALDLLEDHLSNLDKKQ